MSYIFITPIDNGVSSNDLRKARRLAKNFKSEKQTNSNQNKFNEKQRKTNNKKSRSSTVVPEYNPASATESPCSEQNELLQHPLKFPTCILSFDRESPLAKFFTHNGWNSANICRVPHSTGYQAETAVNQIASAPTDMRNAIGQVLLTIQTINQNSDPGLLRAKLGAWLSVTSINQMEHDATTRLLEDDEMLWDIDPGTGYQAIFIQNEKNERRNIVVNDGLANMFGMHKEEVINRLANHDLYLPYLEIDSLLVFLFTLLQHPMPGRRVKYLRMYLGGRCVLVCWCTVIIADSMGRVTEVSLHLDHAAAKCLRFNLSAPAACMR